MDIRLLNDAKAVSIKNKDVSLLIDPVDSQLVADLIVYTDPGRGETSIKSNKTTTAKVFFEPGEYESRGMFLYGFFYKDADQPTLFYKIEYEGCHIAYLPAGIRILSQQQQDELGRIDVLLVNLEGHTDMKEVKDLVESLEPGVVIPVVPASRESLEDFLKVMAKAEAVPVEMFAADRYPYQEDKTEVVVLQSSVAS